jgi:hypothetical protein
VLWFEFVASQGLPSLAFICTPDAQSFFKTQSRNNKALLQGTVPVPPLQNCFRINLFEEYVPSRAYSYNAMTVKGCFKSKV